MCKADAQLLCSGEGTAARLLIPQCCHQPQAQRYDGQTRYCEQHTHSLVS